MCRTTQPALALATSSIAPSSPIASLRFICPSRMASVVAQPACALAVRQSSQSAAAVAALHTRRIAAPCFTRERRTCASAAAMPSANVSRYAGSWLKYRLTSGYVAAIYPRVASAIPIMAANVAAGCRRNARASSGKIR